MLLRFAHVAFVLLLSMAYSYGYQLRGTVSDQKSMPLGGITVHVESTTYGVVTNMKGEYFLELKDGSYTLVFQGLGYSTKVMEVSISGADQVLHVVLEESVLELNTVTVTADGEDPAYPIMRKAVAAKKNFYSPYETAKCTTYIKASMDREEEITSIDSVSFEVVTTKSKENMELTESLSELYFKAKNTYKEVKFAFQDHTRKERLDFGNSTELSFQWNPMQEEYAPPGYGGYHQLFYDDVNDADFNFYQNLISLPKLYDKPFVSPLSSSTFLTYNFKLLSSFKEDGFLVHEIQMTPKRSYGPYFSGTIYIVDEVWSIKAVELDVDKNALGAFLSFRMFINYKQVEGKYWVPEREEFFYNFNDIGDYILGHTVAMYSDYEINPVFEKGTFKNALSITTEDAEDKGLDFWKKVRPITLKPDETRFLETQDSVRKHYASPAYMMEADSSYNATNIWDFLFTGVGYRNSFKGYQFNFAPLIAQPRPFAVGGYRHALSGGYSKVYKESGKRFGINGETSFGFLNNDIRGRGSVSYMFDPEKFTEIEVGAGSIYQMVNTYESIAATFSRSNYVLTEHLSFKFKRELANGFFGSAQLEYSDQKSLEGYELADWSNSLFGELNKPQPFERYTKLVLDTRFTIRFKQKYYMNGKRKVILGSKLPELRIRYKLGIPDVLGSDVSFQFLELRVFDDFKVGSMGTSKYNVYAGTFIRPRGTRYVDYKFFRGSDRFFYSNPLFSFQLLGPTINTKEPYLQGHYVHHFDGAIIDKIPLLNRLRLRTVVGASTLMELSNEFLHAEAFVGISRPFRIREQQFKIGVYYVEASSNAENFGRASTFKFGIDFYNSFTNSWSY